MCLQNVFSILASYTRRYLLISRYISRFTPVGHYQGAQGTVRQGKRGGLHRHVPSGNVHATRQGPCIFRCGAQLLSTTEQHPENDAAAILPGIREEINASSPRASSAPLMKAPCARREKAFSSRARHTRAVIFSSVLLFRRQSDLNVDRLLHSRHQQHDVDVGFPLPADGQSPGRATQTARRDRHRDRF